jgi:urease accessory protein
VNVEAGAGICLLPDPVQPFGGSVYEQSQVFTLQDGASVCLLDWVSAGRTARGEDWDLSAWNGRNEVWATPKAGEKARLLLRDNVMLEGDLADTQEKFLKKKMHSLGLFGTLILKGRLVDTLAAFFMAEFSLLPRIGARDFRSQDKVDKDSGIILSKQDSWRYTRLKQEKEDELLWSAAKVRGCTVVKFGARTVEGGRNWIGSMLKEEGSIETHFGEDSLMCIR